MPTKRLEHRPRSNILRTTEVGKHLCSRRKPNKINRPTYLAFVKGSEKMHEISEGETAVVRKSPQIPTLFGSRRPRVWLRRAPKELHHAIKEYILNRKTQARDVSYKNLMSRV